MSGVHLREARPLNLVGRDHPALHTVAAECGEATLELAELALRMNMTRARRNGLALAAPQVGQPVRLIVWRAGVLLDPKIVAVEGDPVADVEECLSLPGRYYQVPRAPKCTVTGFDLADEFHLIEAEGLDARMFQHEVDHLDGFLASDRGIQVRWHDQQREWVPR